MADDKKKCFLDCSMDAYTDSLINSEDFYELKKMTITFTKSKLKFVVEEPCRGYHHKDVYVNVMCEGKYMYGNTVISFF